MNNRLKQARQEANHIASFFRVLDDVNIRVARNKNYAGQTSFSRDGKRATIYLWRGKCMPDDFIFHEILHIVFNQYKHAMIHDYMPFREAEEMIVQDLCAFLTFSKNNKETV